MATCKNCGKPLILKGGKCLYCGKGPDVRLTASEDRALDSGASRQSPRFNVIKRRNYPSFDEARSFSEGFAMVVVDKYTAGYIGKDGQWVIEPKFYGYYPKYDHRGMYIDERFSTDHFLPVRYDTGNFSQGMAQVHLLDGGRIKGAYIDRFGNIVIKDVFGGSFHNGFAWYYNTETKKYGYIDKEGRKVIPPMFTCASHFSNDIAVVWIDDKPAFIDRKGNVLFRNDQFEILYAWGGFYEDLALVQVSYKSNKIKKTGFIDRQGLFRKPSIGTFYHHFSDGLAIVYWGDDDPGRTIYIDKNMNAVIDKRFSHLTKFREGKAPVRDAYTGESGYIDKRGEFVFKFKYDYAAPFHEGMAAFQLNNKIGYVNSNGEVVIPPQFDSARHFSEGFAAICRDGKWNYIDKSGRIVF